MAVLVARAKYCNKSGEGRETASPLVRARVFAASLLSRTRDKSAMLSRLITTN